jgi:hypothetical protein
MPNHIHPIGRELASQVVLLSRREKKPPGPLTLQAVSSLRSEPLSWTQIPPNLSILVFRAMHVDVKIPGLEILVSLIGELRSGRHRPDIARNGLTEWGPRKASALNAELKWPKMLRIRVQ